MARKKNDIVVPADVPRRAHKIFTRNYAAITRNTNRLLLFACDQKIEHMDLDFQGTSIHADARDPEHMFKIASSTPIGALALHYGMVARYGNAYSDINYIVKLNGKTNLVSTDQHEPLSNQLWSVQDVVELKRNSKLSICGVGYTIYLGSEYEHIMLTQAAQIIRQAHENGLVAIIWIYLRGKAVKNDTDPAHLAGAAGVAVSLGADFVKIKPPHGTKNLSQADQLVRVVHAAGNTKVICSGGEKIDAPTFFTELHEQLHIAHTGGCATGRNIFQRSQKDACAFVHALAALIYDDSSAKQAVKIYNDLRK
jgi:fructose-bisphosphate aldolase / 6-deoxy-5-ketofructose 1-phosphate synthase